MNDILLCEDVPGAPRDTTRVYFDGGSVFGVKHARPSTVLTAARVWDHEQLLDAAHAGSAGGDLHPDLIAALCRRYVDLVQAEVDISVRERTAVQQLAAVQGVAAGLQARIADLQRELTGERSESLRLAQLHSELSAQIVLVTHQRDQAQYDRAMALRDQARQTDDPDAADTLVMAVEDMSAEEMRVFGTEAKRG